MKFKQYIKHVLFLIVLGMLVFLYGFSIKKNQYKKISDIIIEFKEKENQFLTQAMVNKLLIQNNETVKNQAKSVIDLYRLEKTILTNPYIEETSVFLTIDGELRSIIKQRTPIARIIIDNDSYYIDKQGIKIPLSDNYSARVPLVTGVENDRDLDEITAFMQKVLSDDFLQKEIVGVHKSDDGEYKISVRSGEYKIEFGKLEDVNTKFKKLKAFYNKAFLDKTIENYKTINVKYHNQVVCTK